MGRADTHRALPFDPGAEPPISAAPASLPPLHLGPGGDIEILGTLADGGMGRVSLGRQASLAREVAVKTLLPVVADDPRARDALLGEAVVAGQLEHPNIVPIHWLGEDGAGRPVLVMKRVSGVTWEALLEREDHPAWSTFESLGRDHLASHIEILMQVATAVSFAHARGILHRDIKPANVMIGEFGEVYLVDWGIAVRLGEDGTTTATLSGTPQFLAPEMLDASLSQGPWTDVYLLGATLHFVLTGKPRHLGAGLLETLMAAWESPPSVYGFGIASELGDLANQATSRDPSARPPSAAAFRRALRAYLGHRGSLSISSRAHDRFATRPPALDSEARVDETFRVATECRFSFLSALSEWSENRDAQVGLRETLRTLARVEIARRNPKGARSLLAEIVPPDPQIEAAIVELESKERRRVEEESALRTLARENDPSVDSSGRFWVAMLVLVLGGTLFSFFLTQRILFRGGALGSAGLVYVMLPIIVAVCVSVYLGRKRLLSNAMGRRVLGALVMTLVAILLDRVLALYDGRPPDRTMRDDMLICSLGLFVLGLFAPRTWLVGAGLLLGSALVATFVPDLTRELFGGTAVVTFALVAWGERAQAQRRSGGGGGISPR